MKTNPLTSLLNKARTALCPGAQPNSPASPERRGGGTGAGWYTRLQAALNNKTAIRFAKFLIPIALLLFFLLISLVACKSPATLTNDTQHRTRDSNYHASIQRIETHDTIVIGIPSTLPLCRGSRRGSCEGWGGSPYISFPTPVSASKGKSPKSSASIWSVTQRKSSALSPNFILSPSMMSNLPLYSLIHASYLSLSPCR